MQAEKLQGRLALVVQVASLCATGWIVWVNAFSPRLHRYSWATLVGRALGYAVFAYAWSAAITCGLYLAIPRRERGDLLWNTLRTSAAAVWFAPAILLLSQRSPATLAAALVLVVSATKLLYSEWRVLHPVEELEPLWQPADALFGEAKPPRPFFLREVAPALAVSLSIQAAVIAALMHIHLLAGALFATSAAMLTVFSISTGAVDANRPRDLPRSILGVILTILMAAGLTVGGLRGRVRRGGSGAYPESAQTPGPNDPAPGAQPAQPPNLAPQMAATAPDGSFPGVILQPELQKVPKLVMPVMTSDRGLFGTEAHPFSIAFEGEYWMYRFPYRRPPPNSFLRKGTPAAFSFSTPDHWPLMMEARQKLDQPIDFKCCRKVQVELWNADRYPGTVWVELFALNTEGTGPPLRSFLGNAQVQSVPDLTKDPVVAIPETLEFPITASPNTVNELAVVFRLERPRMDKSARIAISRFVLVPR